MMYEKKMMADGGKLKMVEKNGKKVPFYAADGKGKMMSGGRAMYGHGGHASIQEMESACNKMAGYSDTSVGKTRV